jgi:dienelactone hydrolase
MLLITISQAAAQEEVVVDIPTRSGQNVRALQIKPEHPEGSIVLLAGSHGNLSIGPDGAIGWGATNQLVRTRARYALAGFVTLVPDIAPDLKRGSDVKPRYRFSEEHASDIGALIEYLRGVAAPVYVVGTSRAALSVANAAVRLTGRQRPDAIIITSGMLMHVSEYQPSVERTIGRLERITQPTLLVFHVDDECAFTLATSANEFKSLLTRATKVDIELLQGGLAGSGDQCEAQTHHGFLGQDDVVVQTVTKWLKKLR